MYMYAALDNANQIYQEKQDTGKNAEKTLFNLAWKVKELDELMKTGRQLMAELGVLVDKVNDCNYDLVKENTARRLTVLRKELCAFLKGIIRQQHTAATHVFIMMISPEERLHKPYAIPVQCLPYKGLKDQDARIISNKLIETMVNMGMKVAGWHCL